MSILDQKDAVIVDYGVDAMNKWQRVRDSRELMPLYFPSGDVAAYFVLNELKISQDVHSFDDRITVTAMLRQVRAITPMRALLPAIIDRDPGDES